VGARLPGLLLVGALDRSCPLLGPPVTAILGESPVTAIHGESFADLGAQVSGLAPIELALIHCKKREALDERSTYVIEPLSILHCDR